MHNQKQFLQVKEVSEHLGICKKVIREAIYRGELKASKVGKCHYLIRVSDLEQYLLDRQKAAVKV